MVEREALHRIEHAVPVSTPQQVRLELAKPEVVHCLGRNQTREQILPEAEIGGPGQQDLLELS
jgi:hypothetical protein